ncbi:MAG: GNAT family N-acetyltransferase [Bacteroidetes bacterium]|nr:MAG: GNAT family N-acetyltransferase [Bacteroidota bacterium]
MENNYNQIIQTVATVMTDSFKEDPGSMAMMEGIKEPEKLFMAHTLLHSSYAFQTKSLMILDDDPRAFLIGYDSIQENRLLERMLYMKIVIKTFTCLGLKNMKRMVNNMQKVGKVLNLSWYKDHVNGRHYRLKVIAVDKALRGSGAFRRLITPVLTYAGQNQIPVVLETHNPSNVGLYEHFGFTLVKTITHPSTEIKQYCMIRYPEEAAIMQRA